MKVKISILILVLILVLTAGAWFKNNWRDDDIRIAVVDEKGILLKTVSWQRRMVNELQIQPEVEVWIPNGMGWYRSEDVIKLIKQEKNPQLLNQILFYNFGFSPDRIGDDNFGLLNNWRYFWEKDSLMIKKETVATSLFRSKELLDEILPRDFADGRILREDVRLSIYNGGQSNGLASFVANFLERSGVTILGVDTDDNVNKTKVCQINFGPETILTNTGKLIKQNFSQCGLNNDNSLNRGEIELYFGDNYSSMINYPSYINFVNNN